MAPIDIPAALATEHIDDLRRAGERSRLAALVRCCQPATWQRAAARLAAAASGAAAWLRRDQLVRTDNYCGCP